MDNNIEVHFFVIQAVFAETIDVQSTNGPIHGENHLVGPYGETIY